MSKSIPAVEIQIQVQVLNFRVKIHFLTVQSKCVDEYLTTDQSTSK